MSSANSQRPAADSQYEWRVSGTDEARVFLGLIVQPVIAGALAFLIVPVLDWSGRARGPLSNSSAFACSGSDGRWTC